MPATKDTSAADQSVSRAKVIYGVMADRLYDVNHPSLF